MAGKDALCAALLSIVNLFEVHRANGRTEPVPDEGHHKGANTRRRKAVSLQPNSTHGLLFRLSAPLCLRAFAVSHPSPNTWNFADPETTLDHRERRRRPISINDPAASSMALPGSGVGTKVTAGLSVVGALNISDAGRLPSLEVIESEASGLSGSAAGNSVPAGKSSMVRVAPESRLCACSGTAVRSTERLVAVS